MISLVNYSNQLGRSFLRSKQHHEILGDCCSAATASSNYTDTFANKQLLLTNNNASSFRQRKKFRRIAQFSSKISPLFQRQQQLPLPLLLLLLLQLSILVATTLQCSAQLIAVVQPQPVPENRFLVGPPPELMRRANYPLPSDDAPKPPHHTSPPARLRRTQSQIIVPGSFPLQQTLDQQQLVTQVIMPNDEYELKTSEDPIIVSNVIDHKRFIEAESSRCFTSTVLEDPIALEPSFIIITPNSETRVNATSPIELIRMANFDPRKKTTIIVHGFTQSYPTTTWLRKTRALFEMNASIGRYNLIIMDWGKASQGSYAQVAARTSGMGSFLANFVMKLLELGADRMSIRMIGHSLGAHVAGFAGKRLRPRISRITALDPAGPCFGKFFSNSANDRLSPDDAYEVDVYHYDDTFLGLPGQHGQFDVYVNGGSSQPGCKNNMDSMFNALITMIFRRNRVLSESHTRSTEVPTSQLAITGCQQVAYECRDWPAFTRGECGKCDEHNNQCFLMGFDFQYTDGHEGALRTSFPGKRLYIATGANEQFCTHHYQILVKFEPTQELINSRRNNKWRLNLELANGQRERINISMTNQMSPYVFSYLLLTESRPMRIESASLQVRTSDGSIVPLLGLDAQPQTGPSKTTPQLKVLAIEVNFMSNINPLVRRALSSRLCPTFTSNIFAGIPPVAGALQRQDTNSIGDSSNSEQFDQSVRFVECLSPYLNQLKSM